MLHRCLHGGLPRIAFDLGSYVGTALHTQPIVTLSSAFSKHILPVEDGSHLNKMPIPARTIDLVAIKSMQDRAQTSDFCTEELPNYTECVVHAWCVKVCKHHIMS